jgi:hypothetical protein
MHLLNAAAEVPHVPRDAEYEQHRSAVQFFQAIEEISIDLELLYRASGGERRLTWRDLEGLNNTRTSLQRICEFLIERGLKLFDTAVARKIFDAIFRAERQRITQFDDRTEKYVFLGRFAYLYGDRYRVESALKSSAVCLIGYGHHKDPSIYQIIDAIVDCSNVGRAKGMAWLAQIAPTVEAISEITDGDDTGNAKSAFAEALADVHPDWLAFYYERQMQAESWYYADQTMEKVIGRLDVSTALGRSLAKTLVWESEITTLRSGGENDSARIALADDQERLLGGVTYKQEDTNQTNPDSAKREWRFTLDSYPPKRFRSFLTKLEKRNSYESYETALGGWLEHWRSKGAGADALRAINSFDQKPYSFAFDSILDKASDVAVSVLGEKEAFAYFVRAHRAKRGWNRWWSGKKSTRERLRRIAELYPTRWKEFIEATAQPNRDLSSDKTISIGIELWVFFFLLVGKQDEAFKITDTLVANHVAEMADQPLDWTAWQAI